MQLECYAGGLVLRLAYRCVRNRKMVEKIPDISENPGNKLVELRIWLLVMFHYRPQNRHQDYNTGQAKEMNDQSHTRL